MYELSIILIKFKYLYDIKIIIYLIKYSFSKFLYMKRQIIKILINIANECNYIS